MSVAIVTGASRGLGLALTATLVDRGWTVVVDARDRSALSSALEPFGDAVTAVAGDITEEEHRGTLLEVSRLLGRLGLVVNNASYLGPSPQPGLVEYPLDEYRRVLDVNVVAPLALAQLAMPDLEETRGALVNITSDAAVEAYEGWGGYGSSKAGLDHLTAVIAVEHPAVSVYAVDPGDMNTQMHQEAFPDEDITHLPSPEESVPAILHLIESRPPSGRYAARDLAVPF